MADSDPPGLTPEELQLWNSTPVGTSAPGKAATTAPAGNTPATTPPLRPPPPGLTPEETRLFFGDDAGGGAGAPYDPGAVRAAMAGGYKGVARVANAPSAWFGWNPLMDPRPSPEGAAAMKANPLAAGIGTVGGETLATAPALIAASYALPEAGAAGLPLLAARGVPWAAATGAAQGGLTAGERFEPSGSQDTTWDRIRKGAEWGVAFSPLGVLPEYFAGSGRTISDETQQAAQAMKDAGVKVTSANLPRTGAESEFGAAATPAQMQQVNKAWGNIIGEDTPKFDEKTLNTIMPKLGNDVGNAVRPGHIDYDAPLGLGHTLQDEFADIEKSAAGTSVAGRVQRLLGDITAKVGPNNQIAGNDVADILQHGGALDNATRRGPAELQDAAGRIDDALHKAFTVSSPPGVGDAYSLAREKYKLALAGQKAANSVTGNIDPRTLVKTMTNMYKDFDTLGGGTSLTDQAVNFTRNAGRTFGGGQGGPPPEGGNWLTHVGAYVAGPAMEAGLHYGLPAIAHNPLIAGGLIGAGAAYRGAKWAGRTYQNTAPYTWNLLRRGANAVQPYLPGFAGSVGAGMQP